MAYFIITGFILNLIAFSVPKRKPKIELFVEIPFACFLFTLADLYLAVGCRLYWYLSGDISWKYLIVLFGGAPPVAILFVNYFPLSAHFLIKVVYILLWSVFLTFLEWSSVHIGKSFHYLGWNIWYSAMLYPFLLAILTGYYYYIQHLLKHDKWL